MNLAGKKVLIMGMARSGVSAAHCALKAGARVTVTDLRPNAPQVDGAIHVYGEHNPEDFSDADLIVVSPGIPATVPVLEHARNAGKIILSEMGFAASIIQSKGIPIIAVTGTNGKSSVTWFVSQLLEAAGFSVFVGGNLGTALSELAMSDKKPDYAVVEVSSYQLELPGSIAPIAAAALNLTPDHLARHGTMEAYGETKSRIFKHMTRGGYAAVPYDRDKNPQGLLTHGDTDATAIWLDRFPGLKRTGEHIQLRGTPDDGMVALNGLRLLGEHNRDNAAAAILLCVCAGVSRSAIHPRTMSPLPHRLEPVHVSQGVTWINDSKATNVDAALVGIQSITDPVIVLLGGAAKSGSEYERLNQALTTNALSVFCFGEAGPQIATQIQACPVEIVPTMMEAILRAAKRAQTGDSILLSPACASFDEFNNFEERGESFATLAREAKP